MYYKASTNEAMDRTIMPEFCMPFYSLTDDFDLTLHHMTCEKSRATRSAHVPTSKSNMNNTVKVALGVCFALKSWKEYLLLFTHLITLGKDVTLSLITKFKTNRPLSNLFVNRILN